MSVGDFLDWLLKLLGIRDTDEKKYRKLEEKLRTVKAAKVDRLEGLKEDIGLLEKQAKKKEKEYDTSTGETRHIIKGEIERLFDELDAKRENNKILGGNIGKLDLTLGKISQALDAKGQGLDEDLLDEIAADLEDIFEELKETDEAAESLKDIRYEAPEKKEPVEYEKEDNSLSPSIRERLNNIPEEEGEESKEEETGETEEAGVEEDGESEEADAGAEEETESEEE